MRRRGPGRGGFGGMMCMDEGAGVWGGIYIGVWTWMRWSRERELHTRTALLWHYEFYRVSRTVAFVLV